MSLNDWRYAGEWGTGSTMCDHNHDCAFRVADCLRSGGVALLPTDTVYGLAALPDNGSAIARIFAMKNRPMTKNLPVMISGREHLSDIGAVQNRNVILMLSSPWVPGPVTIVADIDPLVSPWWLTGRSEVAFRIPAHSFMLSVLSLTGPLFVTSANLHGVADTRQNTHDICRDLHGLPDYIHEGDVGNDHAGASSTIVNCRYNQVVFERIGAVSQDLIVSYMSSASL